MASSPGPARRTRRPWRQPGSSRRLIHGHTPLTVNFTIEAPYLVTRDHFTERLYHQRTGYWQPDAQGLEPHSAQELAAALDLIGGGNAAAFATAAATLASQGNLGLALDIVAPGLLRHPEDRELAELRRTVLARLMEHYQLSDPFRFLVYAELAEAELNPVG